MPPAPTRTGRCRWRWRRDEGSTTVEAAGYTFLMLMVITLIVQAGVWALADLSARQAAQHGLQTARLSQATAEAGHTQAETILQAINPRGLTNVAITVERGPDTTTVTVTGTALQVLPIVDIPVRAQAAGPTEPDPQP
jgi:Flp pilus assembly protein TadG